MEAFNLLFLSIKKRMNDYAMLWIGSWYKWAGDDPAGFDCSGLVCEIAKAHGALPRGMRLSSAGLWDYFKDYRQDLPQNGCAVFFKTGDKICHVEYCLDGVFSVGASGGGSSTLTVEDAIKANAFIKQRPIERNREIAGYVNLAKAAVDNINQ